jgi:hypothetical protein
MTTLTNIPKHSATPTSVPRRATNYVFFGWMFWFTQPVFTTSMTGVPKHSATLTNVPKH